ncbi:MAG: tRNA (adenosine(37)-N6)-threonylcarbamoyltransferase complex dimerization subunit type 1 TsaB [bacterium]|nr:tRNA (adenosine(37)-N6)-threonylcarbamoyltransferase complex dimerization subunit type 1 TsaB [bacterium]MCM1373979.1 tRNA (adenosine(37)-N6)-threonylcarbamoyltransferase complex dimerization subunit type 1 TsaB [Muribaculum sp.]
MKILAIDSSGLVASVALVEGDVLRAEYVINDKKTHSQTLLPMLEDLRERIDLELDTVDAIAIAAGPGSFTGLRIGSATAKGLGLALQKPLVEVPTLEALAYNLYGTDKLVCPMMDARRSQVYTGLYEYRRQGESCELCALQEQCVVEVAQIVELCNQLGREVIFLGDGVPVYGTQLRERIRVPYCLAPAHLNRQRAGSVAALGAVYASRGQTVSAAEHQPIYLRKSQAEREREEANDHQGA